MVGSWRVWAVDRHYVHAGQHLIEAFPIRCIELLLDLGRYPSAVVIVNLQPERAGPTRDGLSDSPHSDDAKSLAPDAMAQHPGRRPARPVLVSSQYMRAFYEPAGHRQDQGHRHVGGVFGTDARRVGDRYSALDFAYRI